MLSIYTEVNYENTIIELFENMGWRVCLRTESRS